MESQQQLVLHNAYKRLLQDRDAMIENLKHAVPSLKERTIWVDSLITGVMGAMMRITDLDTDDAKNYAEDLPRRIAAIGGTNAGVEVAAAGPDDQE